MLKGSDFCCRFSDNLYIPFPLRDSLMEEVEGLFGEGGKDGRQETGASKLGDWPCEGTS